MSEERRLGTGLRIAFIAFATLAILAAVPVAALASGYFRSFYIPSEAMQPTLQINDRFVARMRDVGPIGRGDIVLVRVGESVYVKRVAAIAGDMFEMIDGVVVLNGRPVAQREVGRDRVPSAGFGDVATRLSEQFPGEAAPHQIYNMGASAVDDYPRITIPPGHVFLLGDNRDNSADSRVRAKRWVWAGRCRSMTFSAAPGGITGWFSRMERPARRPIELCPCARRY